MHEQRATDTLANERTFLAWVRTALAFIGFGFVIARFALFSRELAAVTHARIAPSSISTAFGIGMALMGIASGVYGAYRYVEAARALRNGANSTMPDGAAVISGALIAGIGAIVAWTLFASR